MEGAALAHGEPLAPLTEPGSARYDALWDDPNSFEFVQAVRLLMRLRQGSDPIGLWGIPGNEAVRFSVHPSPAFPASEIQSLQDRDDEPARMEVNFFGLIGPVGVLPLNYTSTVAERVRARDTALRDFLDIFHHRILSLFYLAWEKYRFDVAYERQRSDRFTGHLKDLIGIGTGALQDRLPLPDDSLLFYAGLLALPTRPAAALEQLLADYFGVPAEVEQFVGGWYALSEQGQCRLGDAVTASAQLGLGAVAGDEVWDQQARVRVRLGPLTREQYDQFLPTGNAYERLRTLTRLYGGDQFDVEIQLILVRDDVPGIELGAGDELSPPLGWCTWLRSSPLARDPDETILTLSDKKGPP